MTDLHGESAALRRVVVGLDYETEQPWVWVSDTPDKDAEDYGAQFAVDVPATLIEEWIAVRKREDELCDAIHAAAKFDRTYNRIGDTPCGAYVGEPFRPSWSPGAVIYGDCDACGWEYENHTEDAR